MKKLWIILLAAVLLLCAACASSTDDGQQTQPQAQSEAAAPESAQAWLDLLGDKLPFDDEMSRTEQAAAIYGIAEEDGYTGETAMLISTMATPEEVAVLQADAVYSAEALCQLAQARLAQQKESYASYAPQEVPKLESAVVKVCGEYVIVCVCADNAQAEQLLDSLS